MDTIHPQIPACAVDGLSAVRRLYARHAFNACHAPRVAASQFLQDR
jgi:hypothetical protein